MFNIWNLESSPGRKHSAKINLVILFLKNESDVKKLDVFEFWALNDPKQPWNLVLQAPFFKNLWETYDVKRWYELEKLSLFFKYIIFFEYINNSSSNLLKLIDFTFNISK